MKVLDTFEMYYVPLHIVDTFWLFFAQCFVRHYFHTTMATSCFPFGM